MNNDEHLDIWVKISQQIGELSASIKLMLSKIEDHEKRLDNLEKKKNNHFAPKDSWKNDLLMLLAKAVVIGGVTIATLSGAGSILAKVLGGNA